MLKTETLSIIHIHLTFLFPSFNTDQLYGNSGLIFRELTSQVVFDFSTCNFVQSKITWTLFSEAIAK